MFFFIDSPNCTFLSLYLGVACGFGMICFILKFSLIQNVFHKSYISAYIFYGFLEIYYISFDFGLFFDKLSLIIFKKGYGNNLGIQRFIEFWVKKWVISTKVCLFVLPLANQTLSFYIPLGAKFQVD